MIFTTAAEPADTDANIDTTVSFILPVPVVPLITKADTEKSTSPPLVDVGNTSKLSLSSKFQIWRNIEKYCLSTIIVLRWIIIVKLDWDWDLLTTC